MNGKKLINYKNLKQEKKNELARVLYEKTPVKILKSTFIKKLIFKIIK